MKKIFLFIFVWFFWIISVFAENSLDQSNPASLNCIEKWWVSVIKEIPWWGKYGICILEDNKMCEEWALYNWKCPSLWVKVTWYITEEAIYCAITGNKYEYVKTTDDWMEIWNCRFSDGLVQEARDFYLNWKKETEKKLNCSDTYLPVCAEDSKTYRNSCLAWELWIKYDWVCLWERVETLLETAWTNIYEQKFPINNDFNNAIYLEQVTNKADILSKNTNSEFRFSAYTYLRFLIQKTLRGKIYEKHIKEELEKIVYDDAVLGWTWFVTNIEWLDENTAIVHYEDGHIMDSTKIFINPKNNIIDIRVVEDKINIEKKYKDNNFELSMKIPKTWDWMYWYKSSSNYIEFYYKAKRESNATLFTLNIFTKPEWREIKNIDISMQYSIIEDLGDYILVYSLWDASLYKTDENISNFSIMRQEIPLVIDTLELYYK